MFFFWKAIAPGPSFEPSSSGASLSTAHGARVRRPLSYMGMGSFRVYTRIRVCVCVCGVYRAAVGTVDRYRLRNCRITAPACRSSGFGREAALQGPRRGDPGVAGRCGRRTCASGRPLVHSSTEAARLAVQRVNSVRRPTPQATPQPRRRRRRGPRRRSGTSPATEWRTGAP